MTTLGVLEKSERYVKVRMDGWIVRGLGKNKQKFQNEVFVRSRANESLNSSNDKWMERRK